MICCNKQKIFKHCLTSKYNENLSLYYLKNSVKKRQENLKEETDGGEKPAG